jgi:winged helix-turn-helix DNA-binding protein
LFQFIQTGAQFTILGQFSIHAVNYAADRTLWCQFMVSNRGLPIGKNRVKIIGLITEKPHITTAQLADAIGITPKGKATGSQSNGVTH